MPINFLKTITTKEIKKETSQFNFVLWNIGVLVVYASISALLFLVNGYYNNQKANLEKQITDKKTEIKNSKDLTNKYYTVAYKLQAVDTIQNQNYLPTIIVEYIQKKLQESPGVYVNKYRFLEGGGFEINVSAEDFQKGVIFWDLLLKDKQIIANLNLKSMSRTSTKTENGQDNKVQFVLSGVVKLDKLK